MLAWLLLAAVPPPEPAAVAMILEVTGEVTTRRGAGEARPARAMHMLFPGDRLKTGAKGAVVVVFVSGERRERLGARAEATVTAAGCDPPGTVEPLPEGGRRAARGGLKTLAEADRGSVRLFRSGPEAPPPAVTPIPESRVLTDRPDLSWPEAPKGQTYRVQLSAAGSGRLLWSEKAAAPRLRYPAARDPLRRGRSYEWSVYAEAGEDPPRLLARASFKVASEDEVKDLAPLGKRAAANQATAGDLLLAALAYHAAGAYGEALALFERLCKLAPDNAEFHAARAEYYERAGRAAEAEAAWKRAGELGYPVPKEKQP